MPPTASISIERPPERETVTRSAAYSFVAGTGTRLVSIVTFVALARLLSPRDFGILAMVLTVTGLFGVILELGLGQALVHFRDLTAELRGTAATLQLLVGVALTATAALSAEHVAAFYGEPELVGVLRLASIVFLLAPVAVIRGALLQRERRFRAIARVEVLSSLVAAGVAILLATRGFGAFALAWHLVTLAACRAGLYLVALPEGARPTWSREAARRLWRYGRYVLATHVFNHATLNVDQVLVGKLLGPAVLGPYRYAWQLVSIPQDLVARGLNAVLLSRYAELQGEPDRVRETHLRVFRLIAFVALPGLCLAIALAERFVHTVLGASWEALVLPFRLLAVAEMVQILGTLNGPLFLARGETRQLFTANLLRINVVVAVLAGAPFGLHGVLVGLVVARLVNFVPAMRLGGRPIGLRLADVLEAVWRGLLIGAATLLGVAALDRAVPASPDSWPALIGLTLFGFALHTAAATAVDRTTLATCWRLAASTLGAGTRPQEER